MLWKLLGVLASIAAGPFRGPIDHEPYEATPHGPQNWAEATRAHEALQGEYGDMRFPEDVEPSQAGINGSNFRWPNKVLIYSFDSSIQKDKKIVGLINDAIKMYEDKTCLRFKKRTNEKRYVLIKKDPGKCYSYVGRVKSPQPQIMSLADGCNFIGTVVHEIGHAWGLYHEHQRFDRDTYITVYSNNVQSGRMRNFQKTKKVNELTFGATYDYASIMHYGECAFSKNFKACKKDKKLRTMEAKDGKTKLLEPYERPGLNENDIALLKKLYKC